MAKRPIFALQKGNLIEKNYEFTWHGGFAASQTKKNIDGLHESFKKERKNSSIIEISSKSENPDGFKLSAFNLKLNDVRIENIFQAAKRFEKGGPYKDLLDVTPKEAKRDERLKTSGKLLSFEYEDRSWQLEPKTAFYDYIYISALIENNLLDTVNKYEAFTDIFFNPEKSINCQARACAISKNKNIVEAIESGDIEEYLKVHKELTDRVKDSFEKEKSMQRFLFRADKQANVFDGGLYASKEKKLTGEELKKEIKRHVENGSRESVSNNSSINSFTKSMEVAVFGYSNIKNSKFIQKDYASPVILIDTTKLSPEINDRFIDVSTTEVAKEYGINEMKMSFSVADNEVLLPRNIPKEQEAAIVLPSLVKEILIAISDKMEPIELENKQEEEMYTPQAVVYEKVLESCSDDMDGLMNSIMKSVNTMDVFQKGILYTHYINGLSTDEIVERAGNDKIIDKVSLESMRMNTLRHIVNSDSFRGYMKNQMEKDKECFNRYGTRALMGCGAYVMGNIDIMEGSRAILVKEGKNTEAIMDKVCPCISPTSEQYKKYKTQENGILIGSRIRVNICKNERLIEALDIEKSDKGEYFAIVNITDKENGKSLKETRIERQKYTIGTAQEISAAFMSIMYDKNGQEIKEELPEERTDIEQNKKYFKIYKNEIKKDKEKSLDIKQ